MKATLDPMDVLALRRRLFTFTSREATQMRSVLAHADVAQAAAVR